MSKKKNTNPKKQGNGQQKRRSGEGHRGRRREKHQQLPSPDTLEVPILTDNESGLLKLFENEPNRWMNKKQLRARIEESQLPDLSHESVDEQLEMFLRAGLIEERDGNRYRIHLVGREYTGKLRFWWRENYAELQETDLQAPYPIVLPNAKKLAALPGDRVRVRVVQVGKEQIVAELLEILEHAVTEFVGELEHGGGNNYFIPQDRYLRQDFVVPNNKLNGAKDGQKVRVRLTGFKKGRPQGEVLDVLGEPGQHDVEMHAIINEFRIDTEFSQAALDEAEAIPGGVPETEILRRRDLRHIPTFTIDPEDAKDFDDALSYEELENGLIRLGVHIADVTHYVQPGTALDEDAQEKATSIYLVDRTIPMLPERLSNDLCSLRPNEDRLAYSAIFDLDPHGNVQTEWFGRTVIHSDRRFIYREVQQILDAGEGEFHHELNQLNQLAYKLRDERFSKGSISFETDEVRFILDEDGTPLETFVKERLDAHKLIEDFMLLANRRIAKFIAKQKPEVPFPYRVHPLPEQERLETLSNFVSRFGYEMPEQVEDGSKIAHALNALTEKVIGKPEQNIIQQMAIRSMPKAIYTTDNDGHYGLGFKYYGHFTSPIRRYPDVLVHRILEGVLTHKPPYPKQALEALCQHCSEREKLAADAERASVKFKQAEYIGQHVGEEFRGLITGLTSWGMFVELEEIKIEGMLWLEDIDNDYYQLSESGHYIQGKNSGRKFYLGDVVKVSVRRINLSKRQIDFAFVKKLGNADSNIASDLAENTSGTELEAKRKHGQTQF